jgi:formylglycine-generating enzyme required for sulfatase activity
MGSILCPCSFAGIPFILSLVISSQACTAVGHTQEHGCRAGEVQVSVGSQKLILMRIPAGKFQMGSSAGEEDERPVHWVTIGHDFWMGKYTVTQAQFKAVMGRNPSNWKRPNTPVEQVRWDDVQTFLSRVNAMQTNFKFRLPTEAEWEYACRAGTIGERYGPLKKIAWYGSPFFGSVHPVGQKEPNAFGLYDMLGNVGEWCQDWFGPYSAEDQTDPQGPRSGTGRVVRGGGYWNTAYACRAAWREGPYGAGYCHMSLGFRVAAVLGTP